MEEKLSAGVVDRIIDEEEREGQCKARHGYVGGQWEAQPAQKLCVAQRSKVRKEKPP